MRNTSQQQIFSVDDLHGEDFVDNTESYHDSEMGMGDTAIRNRSESDRVSAAHKISTSTESTSRFTQADAAAFSDNTSRRNFARDVDSGEDSKWDKFRVD